MKLMSPDFRGIHGCHFIFSFVYVLDVLEI